MAAYWMITNRAFANGVPSTEHGPIKYFVSDKGPLDDFTNWQGVSATTFKKLLASAADQFPELDQGANKTQSHITFFVHGYQTA